MLCIKIQLFLSKTEGLGMESRFSVHGIPTLSGMASTARLHPLYPSALIPRKALTLANVKVSVCLAMNFRKTHSRPFCRQKVIPKIRSGFGMQGATLIPYDTLCQFHTATNCGFHTMLRIDLVRKETDADLCQKRTCF